MARATGLQITETAVRLIELDGTAAKFRIVTSGEAAIAAEADGTRTPAAITTAVKACFKATKAGRERVILGMPASNTVIRELQLPFTDDAQIRKVIKFEFESHLPSGGIDDYVVAFHKISESNKRSRVLVFAVLKAQLRELLHAVNRAGVEAAQVDLDAAALSAADLNACGADAEQGPVVLLDADEAATSVVVLESGRIRLVRSMRMGSETLARALTQDLGEGAAVARAEAKNGLAAAAPFGVGSAEAVDGATSAADLREGIIADRRGEFQRRLGSEVRRSISSVLLDGRISAVRLSGGASASPELAAELTGTLGAPASASGVFVSVEAQTTPELRRSHAIALGLALKGLEHDPFRLDFRQEEFTVAHRFEHLRTPLVLGAALVLVLLGFLAIWQYRRISDSHARIETLATLGRRHFQALVVDKAKDPKRMETMNFAKADEAQGILNAISERPADQQLSAMLAALRGPMDHIEKSFGVSFDKDRQADSPENSARSALFRLDQFMKILADAREKTGKLYIDRLEVGSTKITWTMRVESGDAFTILKEGFSKMEGLKLCEPGTLSLKDKLNSYENCRIEFESEN